MSFKETILQEALEVFEQNGIEKVSTHELLTTLDISRGTLQGLASSKREFVQVCILEFIRERKTMADSVVEQKDNPLDALLQLLQLCLEEVQAFSPAFVQDLQQHYPWSWARLTLFVRTLAQQYLNPLLKESIQQGYLQADLPSETVVRLFINHLQGLLNPQLFPASAVQVQDLFKLVVVIYLKGCATAMGQEQISEFTTKELTV